MSKSPHDSASEPAAFIAMQLRPILSKLRRQLREHGGRKDLTPSQGYVLLRLEKDGPSAVSTLARAEGMRPQSMSAIVASLQGEGLVSGAPDPRDGRQTLISLTKKCQNWIREGRAAKQDWLTARIQSRLTAVEQQKLADTVELWRRLAED